MKIENPTKKQIEEALAQIGWSIRHHGCEHYYFYNHKKKCTGMALIYPDTDSRIEIGEGYNKNKPTACFYMKQLKMELIGGHDDKPHDCVSFQGIHDESIFILCQNFDIKSNPQ